MESIKKNVKKPIKKYDIGKNIIVKSKIETKYKDTKKIILFNIYINNNNDYLNI